MQVSAALTVLEVFRVDAAVGIDLQGVTGLFRLFRTSWKVSRSSLSRVHMREWRRPHRFKQAIARVKDGVTEQEEELPRDAAKVDALLALERDHQPLLEFLGRQAHHFGKGVFEEV